MRINKIAAVLFVIFIVSSIALSAVNVYATSVNDDKGYNEINTVAGGRRRTDEQEEIQVQEAVALLFVAVAAAMVAIAATMKP